MSETSYKTVIDEQIRLEVLTEAKRLNGAFRGCVNKVHDEVVQLCVEHRATVRNPGAEPRRRRYVPHSPLRATLGQCQCKARCDHPMLTLSTARRQQATGLQSVVKAITQKMITSKIWKINEMDACCRYTLRYICR